MKFIKSFAITAFVTALTLAGCSSDRDGSPSSTAADDIDLRITVTLPSQGGRAMDDADESTVDDILVLLFTPDATGKPATLFTALAGSNVAADGAGGYSFDTRVGVTPGVTPASLSAVAIANGASRLDDALAACGQSYTSVSASLTSPAPASTDTRLTLWGLGDRLIDTSLRAQALRMTLLRDRARVEAVTDESLPTSTFTLTSLRVFKPSSLIALLPALANVNGTKATAATIPAGSVALATAPVAESPAPMRLYTAESDIAGQGTAMVVGGHYASSPVETFYRVDFADADGNKLEALLRNHRYRVNITAVYGPGDATPEEAYNATRTSVTATVTEWDDSSLDMEFDGTSWIAMPRTATIGPAAGDQATLTFLTNVDPSGWTVEWADESDQANFSVTLPEELDDTNEASLTITALTPLPTGMDSRTTQLRIQVTPRLGVVISVVQTGSSTTDTTGHNPWDDQGIHGTV